MIFIQANFTIHSPITMGPYPHSLEEQELVRVLEQELAQEVAESCQVEVRILFSLAFIFCKPIIIVS